MKEKEKKRKTAEKMEKCETIVCQGKKWLGEREERRCGAFNIFIFLFIYSLSLFPLFLSPSLTISLSLSFFLSFSLCLSFSFFLFLSLSFSIQLQLVQSTFSSFSHCFLPSPYNILPILLTLAST